MPGLSAARCLPGREPGGLPGLLERAGADLWPNRRARGDHWPCAGIARRQPDGRPFTGDYAGDLLYATLIAFGFASGVYDRRPDDGLTLVDCAIINAVRCVPPQNKPTPEEIATCRRYLVPAISGLPRLKALVALGRIAHETTLRAFKLTLAKFPFAHGARHQVTPAISLFDSYHCSRYNTNTGVLTEAMFREVFASVRAELDRTGTHAPATG